MGYDLHITRKDFWADPDDERSISLSEWKAYVESDSEITQDSENPGEENYLFIRATENWSLWFDSELGEIYTKNPESDVIKKMVRIANYFGATVRGDDDEVYDENGDRVSSPSNSQPSSIILGKKPWWKFW
jgi:hypothetical protein